jgi:hypothetical protein
MDLVREKFKSRNGARMAKLTGKITDSATGDHVEARVQVIGPGGQILAPADAMFKVGPGDPFFYSDGEFALDIPRGRSQIVVERGTEFTPWAHTVEADKNGTIAIDVDLSRWSALPEQGWHPGNTHIHYDENEGDPDRRLAYDSRVEDLRMTAISVLKRWELEYATNKYPPGMLTQFTDTQHYVQNGEETRHNAGTPHGIGYGHVMLLNIKNLVEPMSRGLLIDAFAPDYPPLSYACDNTKTQGGIVIWCHNGQGMEAPVAAALGKVDAMNLFDPWWSDVEYDLWYHMLNCGIKLPASTGSDWFVSSANRVYTHSSPEFEYADWLQGLRDGNTFITNGAAIGMSVNGEAPGDTIQANSGEKLAVEVTWNSHYAIDRVELVQNGNVVKSQDLPAGSTEGKLETSVSVNSDGWIAARLGSSARDSFAQAMWAHTSPVYVEVDAIKSGQSADSARYFVEQIDQSLSWINTGAKFYTNAQRKEVLDLFAEGRAKYDALIRL